MKMRTPSDFATLLSVHVNHLNRSVKQVTGKTTGDVISERIAEEAAALLKFTSWNISEIAYSLGFAEANHFTAFFKRMKGLPPGQFRRDIV